MLNNNIIKTDLEEIYNRVPFWECLNDKYVMITGAYGMLASYVTAMLIYLNEHKNLNVHVIAVVRSREKFSAKFGEYLEKNYLNVLISDLQYPISYDGPLDYIIHAASNSNGVLYKKFPVDTMIPNVIGTYNLLELARNKECKGFLFFSSADIYGKTEGAESIREDTFGILDTLDEHNCYGESKRIGETMCEAFYRQFGLRTNMLRIFPTYAPTMDLENDPRAIATFVRDVIDGHDVVLKSNGKKMMSFCYITDAVVACFMILFKGISGEAYNICNSEEFFSVKDLAEIIAGLDEGGNTKVVFGMRSEDESYIENNYQSWLRPSNEKLKNLGWKTEVSVREGFGRVIKFKAKR